MPWLSGHPCRHPGCGTIVRGRSGPCSAHRSIARQRENEGRVPASQRGYDRAWRRLRASWLAEHPYCVVCSEPGTQVDHKIPLAAGGANDESNLQTLCDTHHSVKTGKYDRGHQMSMREKGDGGRCRPPASDEHAAPGKRAAVTPGPYVMPGSMVGDRGVQSLRNDAGTGRAGTRARAQDSAGGRRADGSPLPAPRGGLR